jgi:arginase
MTDIDEIGINNVIKKIIDIFKKNVDQIHISFDIDAIDPAFAPGVGIQVPYGMNPREGLLIMELLNKTKMVCSCEIVEVNPVFDVKSITSKLAVDLILRLLGEKIF